MNLILFVHKDAGQAGEEFKTVIEQTFNSTIVRIFKTFNGLKARLKKGPGYTQKELVVLFVDTRRRLTELTAFIDLMDGRRVFLILPDESKQTLSTASRFFPRFFVPVGKTYDDLCAVLKKLINQEKN